VFGIHLICTCPTHLVVVLWHELQQLVANIRLFFRVQPPALHHHAIIAQAAADVYKTTLKYIFLYIFTRGEILHVPGTT
jgi:hypothetical protein